MPQKQTTSQKRAKLKLLGKDTSRNIYDMLKLADEILRDHEYVDQCGGESVVRDQMEADGFAFFGGSPTLGAMLRAYRHNPERETWEEYHHNIRVMIDLATPEREPRAVERVNWKARCAELETENEALKRENKMLRDLIVDAKVTAA